MDHGNRERQAPLPEAEAGKDPPGDEEGGHTDRYGDFTSEPFADGDHVHHGRLHREGDMPLHDKGAVYVRQFNQQQGTVLRVRAGGGDREEPDLHAHKRSPRA